MLLRPGLQPVLAHLAMGRTNIRTTAGQFQLDAQPSSGYHAGIFVNAATARPVSQSVHARAWLVGGITLALLILRVFASSVFVSDGMTLSRSVSPQGEIGQIFEVIYPSPPKIVPGDRVILMDGRSISEWFDRLAANPLWLDPLPGPSETQLTVQDASGREFEATLPLRPLFIHVCNSGVALCSGPILFATMCMALGVWVYSRRPQEPAAWLMFLTGCADCVYVLYAGMPAQLQSLRWPASIWFSTVVLVTTLLFIGTGIVHIIFLLPGDGRVAGAGKPVIGLLLHAVPQALLWLLWVASRAGFADGYTWLAALGRWLNGMLGLVLLIGLGAILFRYRSIADQKIRRQYRVVGTGVLIMVLLTVMLVRLPTMLGTPVIEGALSAWVIMPYPVFLAAAILRYRFFNITYLFSRALVFGSLTAMLVGFTSLLVFVANRVLVSTVGAADVLITALGIVICVLVFQPLRNALQRNVNRWVYGERDEPAAVLARMSQHMDAAYGQAQVLPSVAEIIGRALRLPWVLLRVPGQPDAHWRQPGNGEESSAMKSVELTYNRNVVAELGLGARHEGDPFGAADERLLTDLARQAGIAAFLTRQSSELQHSRERMVTTREDERLRIRRDLHDGLGPSLGSLVMGIDTVRNLLSQSPAAADRLLLQLRDQAHEIVGDVRVLVYDLRPPALDQLGLLPALRECAARLEHTRSDGTGLSIAVGAAPLPKLTAAHEVALYRLITESLNNVVKHARARHCTVSLSFEHAVIIARIQDDGIGMASSVRLGVGLTSMRERVMELGGTLSLTGNHGVVVEARLPHSG